MAIVAGAVAHRERQILVGGLQPVQVGVVGAEQAHEQRRLGLRLAPVVDPHPLAVERGRDARRRVQARIGALLTRELPDDDLRRVGIDPQREPVRALVIAPLPGVVPERVGVLSGHQVVAKRTFEPRSIARFRRVVLDPVSPVEHEQRQVES